MTIPVVVVVVHSLLQSTPLRKHSISALTTPYLSMIRGSNHRVLLPFITITLHLAQCINAHDAY